MSTASKSVPDVSIIIPTYNMGAFIEEALLSALNQVGVVIEVIVVDDCSTDDTSERIEKLLDGHDALLALTNTKNVGQSKSRNRAMDKATGRYLAFLDADDFFTSSDVLACWVREADKYQSDICISEYCDLFEDGEIIHRDRFFGIEPGRHSLITSPQICNVRQAWEILYDRNFIEANTLRFSTELPQREDRLFFTEALLYAKRPAYSKLITVMHRRHEASTMGRKTADQLELYARSIGLMGEVLDEWQENPKSETLREVTLITGWLNAFKLWKPFLLEALTSESGGTVDRASPSFDVLPGNLLLRELDALDSNVSHIFEASYFALPKGSDELLQEGTFDLARICLRARRFDLLLSIITGSRLSTSAVYELISESSFNWAEHAGMQYLRYNRFHSEGEVDSIEEAWEVFSNVERFVIHSGLPKTGSSAIQYMLEDARYRLRTSGVLYPISGAVREANSRRSRTPGHAQLVQASLAGNSEYLVSLAREIQNQDVPIHTVVLSIEDLLSPRWLIDDETLETANILGKFLEVANFGNVELLTIFRETKDWFRSFYREKASHPFNKFVDLPHEYMEYLWNAGFLSEDRIRIYINGLSQVSKIHTALYEDIRADGVEYWFSKHFDLAELIDPIVGRKEVNRSLTDAQALSIIISKFLYLTRDDRQKFFLSVSHNRCLQESDFEIFSRDTDKLLQELSRGEFDGFRELAREIAESWGELIGRGLGSTPAIFPNAETLGACIVSEIDGADRMKELRKLDTILSSKSWRYTKLFRKWNRSVRKRLGIKLSKVPI